MGQVTFGGERLGSGKRMKVNYREFDRSTHDQGFLYRTTGSMGTLIPFMVEIALPGDSFDIDLACEILTHPTIGPALGTAKVQLDVFSAPIRLYQRELQINKQGIGLQMENVHLPQVRLTAENPSHNDMLPGEQINPSCLFSYLNIRGLGVGAETERVARRFNAVPMLMYHDIGYNYYSNKQEEVGYVIHNDLEEVGVEIYEALWYDTEGNDWELLPQAPGIPLYNIPKQREAVVILYMTLASYEEFDPSRMEFLYVGRYLKGTELFEEWDFNATTQTLTFSAVREEWVLFDGGLTTTNIGGYRINRQVDYINIEPELTEFPLAAINLMREEIMKKDGGTAFEINSATFAPYGLPLKEVNTPVVGVKARSLLSDQEGLLVKTYQSDLFNNYLNTAWIDGGNGVNEVTKIDTTKGYITMDEINIQSKVYNMLNRIAMSDGSYDSWLEMQYSHERMKNIISPVYHGGLSKELVFQEVISQAATDGQPLGTLAGRGRLNGKHKGGSVKIKVDEPSYIMGIVSITPRVDYSQGNKWDTNLKTMADLHVPGLDQIGYQDLVTDQFAWWNTMVNMGGALPVPVYQSAGKQPSWINYQTNVNVTRGNFALPNEQMWMTFNRRYERIPNAVGQPIGIKDLTTYIDPKKWNYMFADTRRDAQNLWIQIAVDMTSRRKMSANLIPNL